MGRNLISIVDVKSVIGLDHAHGLIIVIALHLDLCLGFLDLPISRLTGEGYKILPL